MSREKTQKTPPCCEKSSITAAGLSGFSRMTSAEYLSNYHALHAAQPPRKSVKVDVEASATAAKKPRKTPEEDLHRLIFEWIFLHEAQYPILEYAMHVPNGGARSKGEAGKFKAMGVRKGVVDIINPFPCLGGKGFACELKAPKGILTEEQRDFLDKAQSEGWVTGTCFTLDQFITLVQRYLGVNQAGRSI